MNRYELGDRIGRGGICAVFRAFDRRLKREVAVKRLLPPEKSTLTESDSDILNREALALAGLRHPNIVTVYEFDEDEEGPFAVLELIEGQSFREVIKGGAFSYHDFIEVTEQLIDPLIAASEHNLLHRDIKPENLMLIQLPSGRLQVKILDFGLAKISLKPSTQTVDLSGSFLGSVSYVSPEQFEHRPLDQRTDLYSLGCVLYYSLTQISPFKGEGVTETLQNHLDHSVTPLRKLRPDLPKSICDFVMLLIERNPEERPEDAHEALELFRQAVLMERVPDAKLVRRSVRATDPMQEAVTQSHHTQPAPPVSPTPKPMKCPAATPDDTVPMSRAADIVRGSG